MVLASVSELWVVAAIMVSYGLGTVPGAPIVARRHGVDLRATGDGNPGAWNALDQLGWRRAWPAFAIDGLKGLLAAALGWAVLGFGPLGADAGGALLTGAEGVHGVAPTAVFSWLPWSGGPAAALDAWLPWLCVAAAMLGHALPLPVPGRGGKSVMTFCGGAVGLVPLAGVPLLIGFLASVAAGRIKTGAAVVIIAFPFAQATATPLEQVAWTGVLMTGMGALFLVRRGDRRRSGGGQAGAAHGADGGARSVRR